VQWDKMRRELDSMAVQRPRPQQQRKQP